MANTNSLVTNFNTAPYYDDFDEAKNFHRILFKPGLAVQARELTQIQTILQNQIDRHAEHIFAEGSLVRNGKMNVDYDYYYVKVKDKDVFNNNLNISELVGTQLTSVNTGVTAIVVNQVDGSEAGDPNTKTLYIKYQSGSFDGTTKFFKKNEELNSNSGVSFLTFNSNTAVGTGCGLNISEGVVYAKDHFIHFDAQDIILEKYDNTPSVRVGFLIDEIIVDSDDDYTLLDPANGSFNYAAPGADRLKLVPRIIKLAINADIPDAFIQLLDIRNGTINAIADKPTYSVIRDEFARRTYDESGDYTVSGLTIRIREHSNDGTNGGRFTPAKGGNSALLSVGVEPGKAYVKGYEIQKLVTDYTDIDKAIDYSVLEQQTISTNYGNYVYVNELVGDWDINNAPVVSLYNAYSRKISTNDYSSAPSGSQIGTAILKSIEHESGVLGANNAVFRAYLSEVNMTSSSFSSVKAIYLNNASTADCVADVYGSAILQEKSFNNSVFEIPTQNIRKIRDQNDEVDTTIPFKKKFDISIASTGTFTLSSGTASEIFPYGIGALNETQKRKNFIVCLNSAATVAMAGTVTVSGVTVTGSGTAFTNLNVGDKVYFDSVGDYRKVVSIASDTSMTIDSAPSGAVSGSAYSKRYLTGDIIDFGLKGSTGGVVRTVSVSSSTTIDFDMKETLSGTISASIVTNLRKTEAKEIKKTLKKGRWVRFNLSTAGTTGPYNLGFSDVIKVNSVRRDTSAFTTSGQGTDVTQYFSLDTGQRDNMYDVSKLKVKSGITLTSSHYLLANIDYFQHDISQGIGYYSVDSYPIDDVFGQANTNAITTSEIPLYTSKTTGLTYNLRNCIDTRIVKENTATDTTTVTSSTTNPTYPTTFLAPAGGLHISIPNEEITMDYSYYLPRTDLIILDKTGRVGAIRGVPSLEGKMVPEYPSEAMPLAIVNVAAYPSLPSNLSVKYRRPDYANKVQNVAIRRYTMKDIGTLEKRIENLEYYVTLSMLEKNTFDTKIVDENGLDRFKNGILVDPFNDHGIGDLDDPDYSIAVDRKKTEIRPKFTIDNVALNYASSTYLINKAGQLMKTYTEAVAISQPYAVTTRNAAGLFYNFVGEMVLSPSDDYWVDTDRVPSLQITDDNNLENWEKLADAWTTDWGAWERVVTGTKVIQPTTTVTNSSRTNGNVTVSKTTSVTSGGGVQTTTQSTREREVATVTTSTHSQSYGDRVIDVSVIPYVRRQRIQYHAVGLKPSTRVYAFFDEEDMADYTWKTNSDYSTGATHTLMTNSDGEIWGFFIIPNNDELKFRTGSLIFRLTDSPNNETDAGLLTTAAQSQFTASGISQTKQNTIVSTIEPSISFKTLTQTKQNTTFTKTPTVRTTDVTVTKIPVVPKPKPEPENDIRPTRGNFESGPRGGDPIGQTFTVDWTDIDGAFITSIDLYFASKHAKYGATVEIREVNSAGYITDTVLPFGRVTLTPAQINISSNSLTATNVAFPSPVFVLNQTEYAFVVKPVANNDQTTVWVSKLGREDVSSGKKIVKQPYTGQLFVSSNDTTYEPVADEDIKFNINIANFGVGTGIAYFNNQPIEFIVAETVTGNFSDVSEKVYGETRITVSGLSGGDIDVTDKIVGTTSGLIGTVTYVSGSSIRVKGVGTEGFITAETFSVTDSSNVPKGVTGTIGARTTPTGTLKRFVNVDATTNNIDIVRTNTGNLIVGEQIRGESSGDTAIIASFASKKINLISPQTSELNFTGTNTKWYIKTTTGGTLDSDWTEIQIKEDNSFKVEKELESYSMGANSLQMKVHMVNDDALVSPIVNASRTHATIIHNVVNNDSTGEDGTSGGNAVTRYISKKVTLADGQDAEDLKLFITGYRPSGTDIKVYTKMLNAGDSDDFDSIAWREMIISSKNLYSDIENTQDFKEIEYSMNPDVLTGPNEEYQYVNSAGVTFTGYKYFAVKIVLLSPYSYRIPRCADMRAICLQK